MQKLRVRTYHRKTFVKGTLVAKYHGSVDISKVNKSFSDEKYFDITIYEAQIDNVAFRTNLEGAFPEFNNKQVIFKAIQNKKLPCRIRYKGISEDLELVLNDVKLTDVDLNKHRKLHLQEDHEVFGTLEAKITGFILEEFETQDLVEIENDKFESNPKTFKTKKNVEYKDDISESDSYDNFLNDDLESRSIEEHSEPQFIDDNYIYSESVNPITNKKEFKNPVFTGDNIHKPSNFLWSILGFLSTLVFLYSAGVEHLFSITGAFLVFFVVGYLSSFLKYFYQVFLVLFFLAFIASLAFPLTNSTKNFKDKTEETKSIDDRRLGDSSPVPFYVNHRIWKDYDGVIYEADFLVSKIEVENSRLFKDTLSIKDDDINDYDFILSELVGHDYDSLGSYTNVYYILDSLKKENKFNVLQFAEVIVSMVQDIPYTLLLSNACEANLYNDEFINDYLRLGDRPCQGNVRFGINTPIEFLGTMKGDCDTRTLLIYTILKYYKYDVVVLNSEIYQHSMLGINLPYSGKYFESNKKKYVVWETTGIGFRPGYVDQKMQDMNNFRIVNF